MSGSNDLENASVQHGTGSTDGGLEFPGGRAMVLHNFTVDEIRMIMRMVKKSLAGKDIIFAKSTKKSLKLKLGVLLADMSEDHQYLKDNPPPQFKRAKMPLTKQTQTPPTDNLA